MDDNSQKMKPTKIFIALWWLAAAQVINVFRQGMGQTKNSKYVSNELWQYGFMSCSTLRLHPCICQW